MTPWKFPVLSASVGTVEIKVEAARSIVALVVHEEEGLIAQNRSSQPAAKIVELVGRDGCIGPNKVVFGVDVGVAQIFIRLNRETHSTRNVCW